MKKMFYYQPKAIGLIVAVLVLTFALHGIGHAVTFDPDTDLAVGVFEDEPTGFLIATLPITGVNGTATASVGLNEDRVSATVSGNNVLLTLSVPLDYETQQEITYTIGGTSYTDRAFQVTVEVDDNNNSADTRTVYVNVRNRTEPPIFVGTNANGNYEFTVNENAERGTVVGTIKAEANEEGASIRYYYWAGGRGPREFELRNASDGRQELLVYDSLDYERQQSYTIRIGASAKGGSVEVDVIVNVLDQTERPTLTITTPSSLDNPTTGSFDVHFTTSDPDGDPVTVTGTLAVSASYGRGNEHTGSFFSIPDGPLTSPVTITQADPTLEEPLIPAAQAILTLTASDGTYNSEPQKRYIAFAERRYQAPGDRSDNVPPTITVISGSHWIGLNSVNRDANVSHSDASFKVSDLNGDDVTVTVDVSVSPESAAEHYTSKEIAWDPFPAKTDTDYYYWRVRQLTLTDPRDPQREEYDIVYAPTADVTLTITASDGIAESTETITLRFAGVDEPRAAQSNAEPVGVQVNFNSEETEQQQEGQPGQTQQRRAEPGQSDQSDQQQEGQPGQTQQVNPQQQSEESQQQGNTQQSEPAQQQPGNTQQSEQSQQPGNTQQSDQSQQQSEQEGETFEPPPPQGQQGQSQQQPPENTQQQPGQSQQQQPGNTQQQPEQQQPEQQQPDQSQQPGNTQQQQPGQSQQPGNTQQQPEQQQPPGNTQQQQPEQEGETFIPPPPQGQSGQSEQQPEQQQPPGNTQQQPEQTQPPGNTQPVGPRGQNTQQQPETVPTQQVPAQSEPADTSQEQPTDTETSETDEEIARRQAAERTCPVGWQQQYGPHGEAAPRVFIRAIEVGIDKASEAGVYTATAIEIYADPDDDRVDLDGWKLYLSLPYSDGGREYRLTDETAIFNENGTLKIASPKEKPFLLTDMVDLGFTLPGFAYRLFDDQNLLVDAVNSCYIGLDTLEALEALQTPRVERAVDLATFEWDTFVRSSWRVPAPDPVQAAPSARRVLTTKWATLKSR